MPRLFDDDSVEQWHGRGQPQEITARALAHARRLLGEYEEPRLDEGVDEALRDYIEGPPDCARSPPAVEPPLDDESLTAARRSPGRRPRSSPTRRMGVGDARVRRLPPAAALPVCAEDGSLGWT